MSVATVRRLDPTSVELEFAIEPSAIAAAEERAFRELVRNARIPGFRPGRAPRKVFEAQYGPGPIRERAIEAVVPDAYARALEENALEPVERPHLQIVGQDDAGLHLKATVAVRPQIELGEYRGLAVAIPSFAVGEPDVERALEGLRTEAAILVPAERPVALGDVPTLDYSATVGGEPVPGASAEGQPTELQAERFIPGFAQGVVGLSAGEEREFEATFPERYANAELAGKTARFQVRVIENKVSELPPLDDELAQRFLGEEATLESLRADLRARLETVAAGRRRRALVAALVEKLAAMHEFALPAVLVEREREGRLADLQTEARRAGVAWEEYLARDGSDDDGVRALLQGDAESSVKTTLLLEAIAKAESLRATEADIENEVASLVAKYGQTRETILGMLQARFEEFLEGIVRSKTIDLLVDAAVVSELPEPGPPVADEDAPSQDLPAARPEGTSS
ncbi:MAG: trigger factor [Vulcanimicrobiaceae bacterium]